MKRTTILAFLIMAQTVAADDLTIPKTFQPNTPARAADVNANFSAVEASVDDNAADIAANSVAIQANSDAISSIATVTGGVRVFDATGTSIGRFVAPEGNVIWIVSDSGYLYQAATWASVVYLHTQPVVFETADCTGQAYTYSANIGTGQWADVRSGRVFRLHGAMDSGAPYYNAKSSQEVRITWLSEISDDTGCKPSSGTNGMVPALPNDESITSVPNVAPPTPLLIGAP